MLKRPVLLSIILLSCFFLTACQADFGLEELQMRNQAGTGGDVDNLNYDILDRGPVKGGTLKLFTTTPDTLNPILTKNIYVSDFLSFVYEGLVKLDRSGLPVPVLSDSWNVSEDGLVWNFHIRSDVLWQDGKPLTASDVEYTFDFILNSRVDSTYKRQLQNIATYTASDDSNFKLVLRKPNSFTPELMTFPILPGQASIPYGPSDPENFRPYGTGPFRFDSYDENKRIALLPNENWWQLKSGDGKAGGSMYLDGIDVNVYKNTDDAISAFQTGDVDAVCINDADFSKYNGRTDLIIKKFVSRDFEFLTLNLYNPVFADPYLRKAIASVIDKNAIIRDVYGGDALAADLPVSPESWLFDGMMKPNAGKALSAKELLKEGGWIEKTRQLGENESRYYKSINGVRRDLNIEILANSNNSSRIKAAGVICSRLKAAGMNASVKTLDWNEMLARIDAKKFDMAILGCRTTQIPDISFLYSNSYLPSYTALQGDAGRNVSGYGNDEVNSYIAKIFTENSNNNKKAMFFNMKQIIDEDMPYIGLYFTENAVIYRKNVRGLLDPYIWNRYNDITGWYKPDPQ
jgi:peptide/nickel transport system substrate-binding protein